jgi:hypothetical protein
MRGTTNYEAFDKFVVGGKQFPVDVQTEMDTAIASFNEALAMDCDYSRAHSWLGYSYLTCLVCNWDYSSYCPGMSELLSDMLSHSEQARDLDPCDYSIRWQLMNANLFAAKHQPSPVGFYQEGRQQLAWADYLHAGESDPVYLPERMMAIAYLGMDEGLLDEAIERSRPAVLLRSWIPWSIASAIYVKAGRASDPATKLSLYKQALAELAPTFAATLSGFVVEAWLLKAMCHAWLGDLDDAKEAILSFDHDMKDLRGTSEPWTLTSEDNSVAFARGADRRHWIEGLVKAINDDPDLKAIVDDPEGIGTPSGLEALEAEDYETVPAEPVP